MKELQFRDLERIHQEAVHDPNGKMIDSYSLEVKRLEAIQGNKNLTAPQYAELEQHPLMWEQKMVRKLSPGVLLTICKECFSDSDTFLEVNQLPKGTYSK